MIICATFFYYAHIIQRCYPCHSILTFARNAVRRILDILARRRIARQSEFVELLKAAGIEATQSSVSRDLRELGIAKLEEGYGRIVPQPEPRPTQNCRPTSFATC